MYYDLQGIYKYSIGITGYSLHSIHRLIGLEIFEEELVDMGLTPRNQRLEEQQPVMLKEFHQFMECYDPDITVLAVAGMLNGNAELYLAMVADRQNLVRYYPRLEQVASYFGHEISLEPDLIGTLAATVLEYHDCCQLGYPFNPCDIKKDM